MPATKEQIRQIIADNNLSSVAGGTGAFRAFGGFQYKAAEGF